MPTGSASIGDSTGEVDDETSTTTGPTSVGVTSSVPTSETQSESNSDPTIDPGTGGDCAGCLNAAGICESGEFDDACGRGGSECLQCDAPAVCAEGVCEAPPECGPDNCDGCCDGDNCIPRPSDSACGSGGNECTVCDDDATCISGTCELPCEDTCFGCCTEAGACIEDDDNANACGIFGEACQTCSGDQVCDFGVCSSPGCIDTCEGCCVGDTCYSGFEDSECGFQETCEACVDGQSCDGYDCVPSVNTQWQVTLLDGEIVATQPGGGTWDSFGGAPDPYLDIEELGFMGAFVDDTVDPVWSQTITEGTLTLDLQEPLTFRMRDSDVLLDQVIGVCTVELPDSAFGALHEVTCDVDGAFAWSVLLSIQTVQK